MLYSDVGGRWQPKPGFSNLPNTERGPRPITWPHVLSSHRNKRVHVEVIMAERAGTMWATAALPVGSELDLRPLTTCHQQAHEVRVPSSASCSPPSWSHRTSQRKQTQTQFLKLALLWRAACDWDPAAISSPSITTHGPDPPRRTTFLPR